MVLHMPLTTPAAVCWVLLCSTHQVDLVAVDSVAALLPRAELEGVIGDQQVRTGGGAPVRQWAVGVLQPRHCTSSARPAAGWMDIHVSMCV